ncbi:hypothetical protein Q7C_2310 [Methylophaga frappieri]|jgi:hypothetical protein|uniref:Uncharacterized protein n=1 Tax=Methylophaga frappieri (strain ATCC BAA-2434 / DSM 25690 / JAM7) TaxID=754477 RepID=I1YKK1_METFJ|nr:DUF6447 family protein [Methylophaga frappieri]AFJ03444.1 hypothetical protein Q7C_2310 [Methylophaga frappieri]
MSEQSKTITIDGVSYELDNLSEDARVQIHNVQLADNEIQRLNVQLGMARTARSTYVATLKSQLPEDVSKH